jgi:undecaprenyl-diphosphatase
VRWDRHLERWVVTHRVGFLDPVAKALSFVGSYAAIWIAIAIVLALLWRRPQIFVRVALAAALGEILSALLKGVFGRSRPHVDGLVTLPATHSFPSGHSTTSFACATVLASYAPRAAVPFFVLAALIAWSRVYVGVHYPLDVLAGAALGVAIGLFVVRALPRLGAGRLRSLRARRSG